MLDTTDEQTQHLDALLERRREEARGFAAQVDALVRLADLFEAQHGPKGVEQELALELAGTLHLAQGTAIGQVADAQTYATKLPMTLSLMRTGELMRHQGWVLFDVRRNAPADVSREVEAKVLPAGCGLYPKDLRDRAKRALLKVEAERDADNPDAPLSQAERHAQALKDRGAWSRPTEDGMAQAGFSHAAHIVRQWELDLAVLVGQEQDADRAAGRTRTVSQIQADLLATMPGMVLRQRAATAAAQAQAQADLLRALADAGLVRDPRTADAATRDPHTPGGPRSAPAGPRAGGPGAGPLGDGDPVFPRPSTIDELLAELATRIAAAGGQAVPDGCSWNPRANVVVNVHVPVATLLDLALAPADIDGYGPIAAQHIRTLLPAAALRTVLVDQDSGMPLHLSPQTTQPPADGWTQEQLQTHLRREIDALGSIGTQDAPGKTATIIDRDEPQHDPSASLGRFVDLRDRRCDGQGCSRSASQCDRDHHDPWPQGPTSASNLKNRSRRCHTAKHNGWDVTRNPDGSSTWTSPLGRTYERPPPWEPPPPHDT